LLPTTIEYSPAIEAPREGDRVQLFFAVTLLLSATLMFVVEPLFAKKVLPLLGGSPSVWNTCLVFYQAALLGGYVYAHLSLKWLGARRQAMLHLGLLCLPWLVLALPTGVPPLGVPSGWTPPRDASPVPWLWFLLSIRLGLPFLVIAATAPMLQAWFADTGHRAAKDPYFLYAASNLGSMIGLAAYPLVIEPRLTLVEQSWWWTGGYGLLMALVTGCAMLLWMARRSSGEAVPAAGDSDAVLPADRSVELVKPRFDADDTAAPQAVLLDEAPTPLRRLRWLVLALVPSSLLLGVTTHISTDIASVPLLWAIPLALYLLSFVLVFAKHQLIPHRWMVGIQAVLLAVTAGTFFLSGVWSSQLLVFALLHLAAFFATAMVCHGELAADRPASRYLTEFYLWMSLGGVVGGLLNALVAPLLFKSVMEYPLMLVAACLLRPRPKDQRGTLSFKQGIAISVFALAVLAMACLVATDASRWSAIKSNWILHADKISGSGLSKFLRTVDALGGTYKLEILAMAAMVAMALWASIATVLAWGKTGEEGDRWELHVTTEVAPAGHRFGISVRPFDIVLMVLMALVFAAAAWFVFWKEMHGHALTTELVGLGVLAAFGFARRPRRFAAAVVVLLGVSWVCSREEAPLYCARSFFGVLRVELETDSDEQGEYKAHKLLHGSTLHGTQGLALDDSLDPWTYYHRTGPVGDIFEELTDRQSFLKEGHIGVVGLGTGSIAAYGQPGQQLTYFEIDPAVKQIAEDPQYFTYLSNCRADYQIVLGDARLRLADVPDKEFDVLLIDAFSSDAIPIHLLTREAIQLYVSKLADRGLLAIHISNRHLDLEPVLGNLAKDANLVARVRSDGSENYRGKASSHWVLLTRRKSDLGSLAKDDDWEPLGPDDSQRLWTDDFSNILSVIKPEDLDWKWLPGWKLWEAWKKRAK
jgi:hypothetical protein